MAPIFFNDGGLGAPVRRKRRAGPHPRPISAPQAFSVDVEAAPEPLPRPASPPAPEGALTHHGAAAAPGPAPIDDQQGCESAPAAATAPVRCNGSFWGHLNPTVLIRPDWQRCRSLKHKFGGLALLLPIQLGGTVALLFVARVVLAIGDVRSRFTVPESEIDRYASLRFIVVLAVLYAPIVEEAMVRWPLAHRPRTFLLLPGIFIAAAALSGIYDLRLGYAGRLFIDLAVVGLGVGLHLMRNRIGVLTSLDRRVDRVLLRWPAVPIWLLIVCFGVAHVAPYNIAWSATTILAIPFLVLPQLWFGALATIARIRFGWWSVVVLHGMTNLVVVLFLLLVGFALEV